MDLAKAIIYRLIFGTYKKPNEKILEYATMFHRKGEIFEYLDTSPEIIGKAVNEGRTDIIMYIIGNNQKIAEKDSIEEKIKKK